MPLPPNRNGDHRNQPHPWIDILNFVAVAISITIVLGFLISFILQAFSADFSAGLRSLSASALPLIIISYLTFYAPFFRMPDRVPVFNIYFIFTVWTLILFVLIRATYTSDIPTAEMLFSFTLGLLLTFFRHTPFKTFLSCAYGILSGFLIYVAFVGSPLA